MGHRPLETLPSEEGSQSEHTTQLSVDGEDEGNGPVVEWDRERERGRGEDSQRPKSADSLMQVGLGVLLCCCYVVCWLLLDFCFLLACFALTDKLCVQSITKNKLTNQIRHTF